MMEAVAIRICTSMISAVLKPMAERAGTEILDHFSKMADIKREIENLQITLDVIAGVIQDAEEKQIENISIRTWLGKLVNIGYEARDVLDDFFTYWSLEKAKKASKSVNSKSGIKIPSSLLKKHQLAIDIRGVRMKLQDLMEQNEIVSSLRTVVRPSGSETETISTHERPNPGAFANEQGDLCVGREGVKEGIMQKILNHSTHHVDIIPILGMGGIGKTTLAQSIYNDVRVTEFMYPSKNRLWYFVGKRTLNAERIIMSCIDGQNFTPSVGNIQEKLVAKFKGNKFLIVLDDVWDVETSKWDLLFNTLNKVGKGGVVILTTREAKTVDAVNTTMPDSLQPLSYEQCWSIFERHAFARGNSENSSEELKKIGKKIVAKIKGLPLAAKVVGSSLLNKRDAKIWRSFLSTKEWLPMLNKDNNAVMPALKWSYSHLPPHLKQCFTYCSLFPKDHVFDEKILVEMWMAHDIVHNVGRGREPRRPEDIGGQYFEDLVLASFFQCIDGKYVMHDMIHDLALLVSGEDFITLSEDSSSPQMDTVRHVTIIEDDMYSKNLSLCQSKRILTVYTQLHFSIGDDYNPLEEDDVLDGEDDYNNPLVKDDVLVDVFKQMKSIRVLVLVDITEIPECIKELKHLRYLDVRGKRLKSLPDSLCDLCNLQTLVAPYRIVLPEGVVNMTNLRHLRAFLRTCKGIAKLTSLQELPAIRVCKGDSISELGGLRELGGKLKIKGLENVRSDDAQGAKMQKKPLIEKLSLEFDVNFKKDRDGEESWNMYDNVLKALTCPPNLTTLNIRGYHGHKFPSWLTIVQEVNLVENLSFLEIFRCQLVGFLELDASVSLKTLHVQYCSNLKRISLSQDVADAIEDLCIGNCPELMETQIESLPSLKKLHLSYCDKLSSFPPCLVKIESLHIEECQQLSSLRFSTLLGIKSLNDLEICYNPIQKQFYIVHKDRIAVGSTSEIARERMDSLKHFFIDRCPKVGHISCSSIYY